MGTKRCCVVVVVVHQSFSFLFSLSSSSGNTVKKTGLDVKISKKCIHTVLLLPGLPCSKGALLRRYEDTRIHGANVFPDFAIDVAKGGNHNEFIAFTVEIQAFLMAPRDYWVKARSSVSTGTSAGKNAQPAASRLIRS